jgi:hypothetical protein
MIILATNHHEIPSFQPVNIKCSPSSYANFTAIVHLGCRDYFSNAIVLVKPF